jgi:hypothetical protein
MRSNYRHERGDWSRDRRAARRNTYGQYENDVDMEEYSSYGGDEYDEEGSLRGAYEGEDDEFDEYFDEDYSDEDYHDYSVAGAGRNRRGYWREVGGAGGRNYRSSAGRGSSSRGRRFASMTRDRVREIAVQGGRTRRGGRDNRGGW